MAKRQKDFVTLQVFARTRTLARRIARERGMKLYRLVDAALAAYCAAEAAANERTPHEHTVEEAGE